MKKGIELISEERQRQIDEEGFTAEHDDKNNGAMAMAAQSYLNHATGSRWMFGFDRLCGLAIPGAAEEYRGAEAPDAWPCAWNESWWKPTDPIRDLVKAGALIAAEIDRLSRQKN